MDNNSQWSREKHGVDQKRAEALQKSFNQKPEWLTNVGNKLGNIYESMMNPTQAKTKEQSNQKPKP
jgi:hypothetical protein